MTLLLADLLDARGRIQRDLSERRLHVLAVLRNPPESMASVPVGDVLCWADGLDEGMVARVLAEAGVEWGKRIDLLSAQEIDDVCSQIKDLHPEVWKGWRKTG